MGPRFDPWSGTEIPHAATKTQCSQIKQNKMYLKKKKRKKKIKKRSKNYKKYMKFALKNIFFCKVIVGYRSEN